MNDDVMLWRGLSLIGHEYARLSQVGNERHLNGVALFAHEGKRCRLDYAVRCDERWVTKRVRVSGWIGDTDVEVSIQVEPGGRWIVDGAHSTTVDGCIDIDLNFSPSTNLLPIRRLGPLLDSEQKVRAAWLRFPSMNLEPLEQSYLRLDDRRYRYRSGNGFSADLRVNASGFVTDYPDAWVAV